MIHPRHRQILHALWRGGPLSQSQLHEQLGIRKNTVSEDVAELLRDGLLREMETQALERGRPRTPLEIDPARRHVLGLSIQAGRVELAKVSLRGQLLQAPIQRRVRSLTELIRTAERLLVECSERQTFAVGLATPGIIDPQQQRMLLSVLEPGSGEISLRALYEAASPKRLVVENDVHAMAARWMLSQAEASWETVLLVFIEDGQLGAAFLVDGHPSAGCVIGAHELGHTRLPVGTEQCYCGHAGCLERICSSVYLRRQDGRAASLAERSASYDGRSSTMRRMIELLACGLGNAVNLIRPHRLVLVSPLMQHKAFSDAVVAAVRDQILRELVPRVRIELWDQPSPRSAETAAWLALAGIYYSGWTP